MIASLKRVFCTFLYIKIAFLLLYLVSIHIYSPILKYVCSKIVSYSYSITLIILPLWLSFLVSYHYYIVKDI